MMRAQIAGTYEAAVSAGHPLAADIAAAVLHDGGNAVDAGIAAVLALCVLHCEQVQFGGICPMLYRVPDTGQVHVVEGVGRWPRNSDPDLFMRAHQGVVPPGILRTVTPALPDACLEALRLFGTMTFADLARPARDLAANGFDAHPDLAAVTSAFERRYRTYRENAALWLPEDRPVAEGDLFRNPPLADLLGQLVEVDMAARRRAGRAAGLAAVRHLFYEGHLAERMARHVAAEGGWLTGEDLAAHVTPVRPSVSAEALGARMHACGPWSQGPCLIQMLQILEVALRDGVDPQTGLFWHTVLEAMRLGFADRDAFYGDPDFVATPLNELLSRAHAEAQAARIGPQSGEADEAPATRSPQASLDTSVVAVCDAWGGVFVATPSDASMDGPAVPGMGFVLSTRGGQSRVGAEHPAALAPGKRPRVSACPFLVETPDGRVIAGGGPGGDLAIQAAAQVLCRHLGFDEALSSAVAAPRCFTMGSPNSSAPHLAFPGKVHVAPEMPDVIADDLAARGHDVSRRGMRDILNPSLCLVEVHTETGAARAMGDPRRLSGQRRHAATGG